MTAGFDVALAVRRTVATFAADAGPILLLGFGLVALPEVALALAGSNGGSTVVATIGGMLHVLFVVVVAHGALVRLQGRPLPPARFTPAGIAASPRAIGTALLLGVGVVLALVGLLLAGRTLVPLLVEAVVVVLTFSAAVVTAPAVPLALVARPTPVAAVAAAVRLTRGRRSGIAAFLGIAVLTAVPARLVLAAAVYGPGAGAAQVAAADAAMTVASPGLWLLALLDLGVWGVGAVLPAVVFVGVAEG